MSSLTHLMTHKGSVDIYIYLYISIYLFLYTYIYTYIYIYIHIFIVGPWQNKGRTVWTYGLTTRFCLQPLGTKHERYSETLFSTCLNQENVPSIDTERAARKARLARFGSTKDCSEIPSDDDLRNRKTISISARNAKAAAEQMAESVEKDPSKSATNDKDKNEYWGGDSTVFED